MRRTATALLVVGLMITGCTEDPDSPEAVDPEGVVATVIDLISEGRYTDIARITDPDQAELLLLLEGTPPDDILSRIDDDTTEVAANFWEGFAESAAGSLGTDATVTIESEIDIGSERGFVLAVSLDDGRERRWVVRNTAEGPVVDLFASFASGFAGSLIEPVDRLLVEQSEDQRRLLALLVGELDSLQVASTDPNITTTESQEIITLIERISRAQG